ncbi:MAG: o-succinylbenzoate synthase [Planctomycetota bacterium]
MPVAVRFAPYHLPLHPPFAVGDHKLEERRGLIVELRAEEFCGYGDVAPLPGLHRESLREVRDHLKALSDVDDHESLAEFASSLDDTLPPSLRFGLESAWLGLAAARRGVAPANLLDPMPRPEVQINGLLDVGLRGARRALEAGDLARYPTIKVKVGRRSLEEEHALLALLVAELPAGVRLRLDGNRRMDLADACALLDGTDPGRIDWIEEPLRDPSELGKLYDHTGVRLALDESLQDQDDAETWRRGIAAWVAKPGVARALQGTMELGRRAADAGLVVVVSSSLESGLGLWSLATLAACLNAEPVAAGLGTDRWLASDIIDPPFTSTEGAVALTDAVLQPSAEAWPPDEEH